MTREQFIKKWAVYAGFLLLLHMCQSMILSAVSIFGAHPMIVPLAVSAVALFEGSVAGGGFGMAAGFLCDLSFHESTVRFLVFFTLLGVLIGRLTEKIITKGFPSYLICGALSLVLMAAVQAFPFLAFERLAAADVMPTAISQTLCSLLFLLPVYYASRTLYIRTGQR